MATTTEGSVPIVRVPGPLQRLTDGAPVVVVPGSSVREVIMTLDVAHVGIASRILDEHGELRRFVNVFVGEEDVRDHAGIDTPVSPDDTITIVPAVAGG